MGINGLSNRNMEDFFDGSDLNCGSLALEVSEEKNFNMWLRECSYDTLVKNVTAFCPCLKSLSEAKIKRFILIALTKEVLKKTKQRLCSLAKSQEESVVQV